MTKGLPWKYVRYKYVSFKYQGRLCDKFYYYWGEEYRSLFMLRDELATARRSAL